MTDQLVYWVESLMSQPLFYPLVAGFVFIDALFPLVPSEVILNAAGAWAVTGDHPDLIKVFWFALLGGVLGDNVCYLAGRLLEKQVQRINPDTKPGQAITWVKDNMHRGAGATIVVARFIPWGRWACTILLGSLRYRWWLFLLYDTAGVIIWALVGIGAGYLGGMFFQNAPLVAMISGIVVGTVVGLLLQRLQNYISARRREA